ncbi:MAG: lamin tail domain-containing protein, partial [Chitinophagales bacterium]|nr:lamin tail domain-containing protein [Chitinophagales bacterium]
MNAGFGNHTAPNPVRILLTGFRKIFLSVPLLFALFFSTASQSQIVINEVGIAPSGGDGYHFIELYNRAGCTIDISCYTVVYNSDAGSGVGWTIKIPTGTTITSGGYYLIGGVSGTQGVAVGSSGFPIAGGTSYPYLGTPAANLNIGDQAVFPGKVWVKNSTAPGRLTNSGGQITLLNSTGIIVSSVSYNSGYVSGAYPMSSYTTCNPSGNTQGNNNIAAPGAATQNVNGTFSPGSGDVQGIYLTSGGTYATEQQINFSPGQSNANGGLTQIGHANAVSINADNNGLRCEYEDINLSSGASGGTGTLNYTWSFASSIFANTANTTLTNVSTADAGVYTATATDSYGCSASATTTVVVNPAPKKFNVTSNATTVCNSTGVTIGLDNSEVGVDYEIIFDGGLLGLDAVAGTGGPVQFTPVANFWGPHTFEVIATNKNINSCTAMMNGSITVMFLASPLGQAITIMPTGTGPTVCEGTPISLLVPPPPAYNSYQWYLNGTPISGATTFNYSPAASGNYGIVVTNSNGCPSPMSDTDIVIHARPVPIITGPNSVCLNATGNVYTTEAGASNYSWTVSAGGTITSGNGTNSITVTWNTSGPKTVSVNYTDANGCTAASATVYNVTVNALPTASAGSNSPVCSGTTLNLTASGGATYSWTGPNGFTSNSQNPSITNVTTNASGDYTVTVTDGNGCSATATTNVVINQTPVISASPSSQVVCSGENFAPISISTNIPGVTYSWTRTNTSGNLIGMDPAGPTGTLPDALTGALTNTTTLVQNSTFTFTAISATGCLSNSTTATVTVNPPPTVTPITGPTSVCVNSTITLANATAGGVWTSNDPGIATVNSTTGVVTGVTSGSVVITYTVTNIATGCKNSVTIGISVNPSPVINLNVTGATSYCPGGSNTLTASGLATTPNTLCFTNNTLKEFLCCIGVQYQTIPVSGIPAGATITGITLTANVDHQRDREVALYLLAPGGSLGGAYPYTRSGPAIVLVDSKGGTGQNFRNTVFSDAGIVMPNTGAPYTGTYQPVNSFASLIASIGAATNANGNWRFGFVDHENSGYTGVYRNVTLCITYTVNEGTYTWSSDPADPGFNPTGPGPFTVNPTTTTTYTVTGTAPNGCTASQNVTITILPTPTLTLTSAAGTDNQTVCVNSPITPITYAVGGGAMGANISWSPSVPNGVTYTPGTITISGTPTTANTYTYTLTPTGGSCTPTTATGTIRVSTPPTTTGVTICQGGSGVLTSSFVCPPGSPVTVSNVLAGTGTSSGTPAWNNPTRVNAADGSSSTTNGINRNSNSGTLNATNFNFSTIPNNATITGIQVTIRRSGSVTNAINDGSVKLIVGGVAVGTNNASKSDQPGNWGTTLTAANYGSSNNLTAYWGVTLSGSDVNVNNTSFGLAFVARNTTGTNGRTASIDYIRMTITYTVPGSLNWYTQSSGGSIVQSGSSFNPINDPEVLASGFPYNSLINTLTPGIYKFYVECSTSAGCRTETDFVINAKPTAFNVTGGGSYCTGGSGVTVGLSGSESGVNYQLVRNGTNTGSPVAGTGSAISFGNQTVAGTYTVIATNTSTTCTATMTGNVTITVNPLPTASVTAASPICS